MTPETWLPEHWNSARLADITTVCRRGRAPAYDGGATLVINQKCVRQATEVNLDFSKLTNEGTKALPEWVVLRPGDILLNSTGSGTLGRVGWLRETPKRATVDTHVAIVRPSQDVVTPAFLGWYLHSLRERFEAMSTGSTNQRELRPADIGNVIVPLPPIEEQGRIVGRIEESLASVGAGQRKLAQASNGLAVFRASVVAGALRGEFAGEASDARASDELDVILTRRRQTWEQTEPKKRYSEPVSPNTPGGLELPEDWTWATVDQLSTLVQYGSSAKTDDDADGVPVLRMGNVKDGRLVLDPLKYLPREHDEFPRLFLDDGDLVFNRTNSPELVGKVAVARGLPAPCSFASYLIRVRLANGVLPEWVSYYLNSSYGRAWVRSVVTQQVGQANVNGTKLRAVTIPLPPESVQRRLVDKVEGYLRSARQVDAVLSRSHEDADSLTRSVLQAAFSGRLDTQPRSDESSDGEHHGADTCSTTPRAGRNSAVRS